MNTQTPPLNIQAPPPVPTSVADIPPPTSFASTVIESTHLKDVIATPLYAYVKRGNVWQNYDRRDLVLSARGTWRLIASGTATSDVPFKQSITLEEGITTTEAQERAFASEIGVSASVPNIGLGASITHTLSSKTTRTISISNKTTTQSTLTATTKSSKAVFWFWQLDVEYIVSGKRVTWEVDLLDGIAQLTGANSRPVPTLDGPGRERLTGQQAKGARRIGAAPFETELPVNGSIMTVSQFPAADSSFVDLKSDDGKQIPIRPYEDIVAQLRNTDQAVAA